MADDKSFLEALDFVELESRFGLDNARAILRTLEQFEGIGQPRAKGISEIDRMRNVMVAMKDNIRFQTRH